MALDVEKRLITVGQTVEEDDDFAVIRVAKHNDVSFKINEGDKFYTLLFIRQDDAKDGSFNPYHPFWHEKPEHFDDGVGDGT